jgi:hypothetical protein
MNDRRASQLARSEAQEPGAISWEGVVIALELAAVPYGLL